MTTYTRVRTMSHTGGLCPAQHTFRLNTRQPVAALISARRLYWKTSSAQGRDCPSVYNYMRRYPDRSLPHYVKYHDGLQYSYASGLYHGRVHTSRSASSWGGDNAKSERAKDHGGRVTKEALWETRSRIAGERYLRLMEGHMAILRKNPYWGLFGVSEMRGVWNPWKRAEELRRRLESEFWEETTGATERPSKSPSSSAPAVETKPAPSPEEEEYVYDPVANKRVRRPAPEKLVNVQPLESPRSRNAESEPELIIPVKPYGTVKSTTVPLGLRQENTATSAVLEAPAPTEQLSRLIKGGIVAATPTLTGFARQPWLAKEGFLESKSAPSPVSATTDIPSVWNKQRAFDMKQKTAAEKVLSTRDKASPEAQFTRHHRWAALEDAAVRMFIEREGRLAKEFAAGKWELKRGLSAYPGDIAKTPEDLRARRQLLERSLSNSVDLIELQVYQTLNPFKFATARREAQQKLTDAARDAKIKLEQARKLKASEDSLQREIAEQKYAMETFESRPRPSEAPASISPSNKREGSTKATHLERTTQRRSYQDLVQEIREIYEGTYGKIDTKHRQPDATALAVGSESVTERPMLSSSMLNAKVDLLASTKRLETSLSRSLTKSRPIEGNDNAFDSSTLGVTSTENHILPALVKPRASLYPFDSVKGLDSAEQILQASVRDFEQIMKRENKTVSCELTNQTGASKVLQSERNDLTIKERSWNSYSAHHEAPLNRPNDTGPQSSVQVSKDDKLRLPATAGQDDEAILAAELDHVNSISEKSIEQLTADLAEVAAAQPQTSRQNLLTSGTKQSYIVLAYDKQERKVRATMTSSKRHEDQQGNRSIDSILGRLYHPTEYFDFMARLESAGYELVAGGRNMLVYKDAIGRGVEQILGSDLETMQQPSTGWGSPRPDDPKPTTATNEVKDTGTRGRPVRRIEENFSGIPPRAGSEQLVEELEKSRPRRDGPVWKLFRLTVLAFAIVYGFGVTLEWMKDREKNKLIAEYRAEVKRVQEVERQKTQEQQQSRGFGWGL